MCLERKGSEAHAGLLSDGVKNKEVKVNADA